MENRTRLAVETVQEIRRKVGAAFPIPLRVSRWKQQDYSARLFNTPKGFEMFLSPFVDAGVDVFHCSPRRFWKTEFGSGLNLAVWAKTLSGKPAISVGSVGLTTEHVEALFLGALAKATIWIACLK